jgi:hypothetical protein
MPEKKNNPGGSGLSLYQIAKKVKREYDGVGLHPATIWKYVNANISGVSPLKPGVKGDVPDCTFKSLCIAFESYIHIQQINSRQGELTYKKLAVRINHVLKHNYKQKMLQGILSATAKNLDASTMDIAKDWQVCWTTFVNISSWFDKREFDLVDLGFATRGIDGTVTILDDQLPFILNFDETCLLLDSSGRKEG